MISANRAATQIMRSQRGMGGRGWACASFDTRVQRSGTQRLCIKAQKRTRNAKKQALIVFKSK